MSNIKVEPVDLSVPLRSFRICPPLDRIERGNICLLPAVRSFFVMHKLERFGLIYPIPFARGCMWSKCVRESITCSVCDYNLFIL